MELSKSYHKDFLSSVAVTLVAFLILAVPWAYKVFIHPRPYWIEIYDPEMVYFYDGLALLNGELPRNTYHPGTPINLISAGINGLMGYGPFEIDKFRVFGYILAFILNMIVAFFLVRKLFRKLPPIIQVAGLWTYFLQPAALGYNNIWSPEMFYYPAGSLVLITLWGSNSKKLTYGRAGLIGLAVGLCCAIKFAFLCFVVALVIALLLDPRSNLEKKLKAAGTGLFGIFIGFIAGTIVVYPLYFEIFGWLWSFASHKGPYFSGSVGLPELTTILTNLRKAVFRDIAWNLWLVLNFCFLGFCLWRESLKRDKLSQRHAFLAIFAFTALMGSYALVIPKAGTSLRHLLPTAITAVLAFALAMQITPPRRLSKLKIPIIGLVALLMCANIAKDIYSHRKRIVEGNEIHQKIADTIKKLNSNKSQATIIYSYRFPQPSYALRFWANEKYLRIIETRFPFEGHYNPWRHKIFLPSNTSSWDYLIIRSDQIAMFPKPLGPILATVGRYSIFWSCSLEALVG